MTARIGVFLSVSGRGGVERMVFRLCQGMAAAGHEVDLLTLKGTAPPLPGVRIVPLPARHTRSAVGPLADWLARERPAALLAAKDRAIRAALRARRRAGVPTRVVGRLGTHLSTALAHRDPLGRWLRLRAVRRGYRDVDALVAVSAGVREDTLAITGLPPDRVRVVRNPVITPDLDRLAAAPVEHPWYRGEGPPVVVGAGRLTRQKDFPTLLRAFARLRARRPARLVILGEGSERSALLSLAGELGIAADVDLPGHQANPWAWLAGAAAFALSSRWEGSPNVLTEAMALGVPVVATDCPSGPGELLAGGEVAPLVPVGDAAALAAALERVLERPPDPASLRAAVADYTLERSTRGYLAALGLA